MPDVITAGETMVLGVPARPGRLRHSGTLELKIGGAESNVAIALCRLGVSTGWASYLSADEPGQLVLDRVHRSKLWTPKEARQFVEQLLPEVDLLFVSAEESVALWDTADDEHLTDLASQGPQELLLKKGTAGNVAWIRGELLEQSSFAVSEVDPVGARDAFAAGYLAGLLWEQDAQERLRLASAMGALSVTTLGDYEALPDREELESFMDGRENLGR